ncbi:potassium channel family protein [Paraglaciecola psychrophila]|uniref:Potassium channel domain-containing protein n=1 Tax=Paraglaciecola psychrophila 170 TaxID=1129794 RepID=K7AH08_9ALTE|nr:potassium channel family protein [Paraglaciecola psychrophila]AGH46834.1 hypothetical protein C427_4735 [Paraglaciecola psychrophila 170]GAC39883.1 hypothetical protein GPSY_4272 [Paraglaciecola psychrophila 170]
MFQDWYISAAVYLEKELRRKNKCDGMDVLNDYVLENREDFAEIELDDLDDFVTAEFEPFKKWLLSQNFDWLEINSNGIWVLKSSNNQIKAKSTISLLQKLNFDDREKRLIDEDIYNLNTDLIDDYINLIKKLAGNSNNKQDIVFRCKYRLALCAKDDGNIPSDTKIYYWIEAAEAAKVISNTLISSECFMNAAQIQQKENYHRESAKNYEFALELQNDKTEKIQLARYARVQYEIIGDHQSASKMFVLEKDIEKITEENQAIKFILWLHRKTSLYGEKPSSVIKFAAILLAIATLLVFFNGTDKFCSAIELFDSSAENRFESLINNLGNSIYFSFVTFTTLGYGEITPVGFLGKLISICLSVSGLLLTTLFMVTFVRKYSRP